MIWIVRIITALWAFGSVGVGALAFIVVHSELKQFNSGPGFAPWREAIETIPEAVMMTVGFKGAPWPVTAFYWGVLFVSLFFAWKPRGCQAST